MQTLQNLSTRIQPPEKKIEPEVPEWIMRLFGSRTPLGYEAGDSNLYRYVKNDRTNETDPSGLIGNAEASRLVNHILDGTRPLADLAALTPQQFEAEISILQRVITAPRGAYPAELIQSFNEARISFLRGAGERPGSLLEFAEKWLSRQSSQWLRVNRTVAERIAEQAARTRELAARRAAEAATEATARRAASRALSGALRLLCSPITIAVSELFLDPRPTAGVGRVGVDQLMFPEHSPEIYLLPVGTYILPNGLIYLPSPNSTFRPPPGTVRVTGRVTGQGVLFELPGVLSSDQVRPVE